MSVRLAYLPQHPGFIHILLFNQTTKLRPAKMESSCRRQNEGDSKIEIVGKGENAGYQLFLFFPQCFQKAYFTMSLKVRKS